MINLSANISLLFREYDFLCRFKEAKKNSFDAVEFQFPYDFDPHIIKNELELNNLFLSIFNSPPGNFKNGDRGLACISNREKDFNEKFETETIEMADFAVISQFYQYIVITKLWVRRGRLIEERIYTILFYLHR